jgi:hypothetical protein
MQVRELGHSCASTLAFRARVIQPKSINTFSTGAAALLIGLTLAADGCAGGKEGVPITGDRTLEATPGAIDVSPGGSKTARFELKSGNVPIAGQIVNFSIADGASAKGATLSTSSAVTDVAGGVTVEVHAGGEALFVLVATSDGAPRAEVEVVVQASTDGTIVVVPFYTPIDEPPPGAISVKVRLYNDANCSEVALGSDALAFRISDTLPVAGGQQHFDFVSVVDTSAVLGQAFDSKSSVVAQGCIDLPGPSLGSGVVHVALPLRQTFPDPIGTFAVTSDLVFAPPLAASAAMAAPWQDLADCPLDPAQLWLDCTIDALSQATADDPLDCKVSSGGEGPIGDALTARRGDPVLAGGVYATGCRGPQFGPSNSRSTSLDAVVLGLFGSPLPTALVALPGIARDAASILDRVTLKSMLDVRAGGASSPAATGYTVSHTLVSALFGPPRAPVEIPLAPLALPVLSASAPAQTRDGQFVIERHGFTLRLGASTRAAFGALALESRGLPGDAAGLVAALAALARSPDGKSTGCAALDAAVCPAIGEPVNCVTAACLVGSSALAERLDAAFDVLEGTGLDLNLEGSGPLIDSADDPGAERIGRFGNSAEVGIWSVDLRTAQVRTRFSATFEAVRAH